MKRVLFAGFLYWVIIIGLVIAKACGLVAWSWAVVLSPLWIMLAVVGVCVFIVGVMFINGVYEEDPDEHEFMSSKPDDIQY